MASITKLKTPQNIQFFDHTVALNLVQAFHRHLDLGALLELFFSQASAVLQVVGMRYRNPAEGVDVELGKPGRHTASYNLTYQNDTLGELIFSFDNRVTEDTLATAEDLLALVMSPVKNALAYRSACLARSSGDSTPEVRLKLGSEDALLLVSLDGFDQTARRDGGEWAQALVHAMQLQIRDGLREGDGVYQIDDSTLAVLLPRTPEARALEVARKIRVLIAGLHLKDGSITTQLTACIGIATTNRAGTAEDVLAHARDALGRAQAEGPSSITCYPAAND